MGNINLKKRNICVLSTLVVVLLISVYERNSNRPSWYGRLKQLMVQNPVQLDAICNHNLQWYAKEISSPSNSRVGHDSIKPIGILGPPGSGVLWLRFIIEQLTGIHTGSPVEYDSEVFKAEKQNTKVLAIMTHDISLIPTMHSAILMYRGLKDTIRTRYSEQYGPETDEISLKSYQDGNQWKTFVMENARIWADSYKSYSTAGCPLLVVTYEELSDPKNIQSCLLKFSNFFRVPVKQSNLKCVMENSNKFPLKPRPLNSNFKPFSFLSVEDNLYLSQLENETEAIISDARKSFRPKV